jgi:beta-lactamase class A
MDNSKRTWAVGAAVLVSALLTGCTATGAEASTTATAAAASSAAAARTAAAAVQTPAHAQRSLDAELAALEQSYGARVGVTALDTGTGRTLSYRGGERFAFDSTGKVFTASMLLATESDAKLDTVVHYTAADLQSYSPITSQHVDTGMTVRAIIDAALQYSDNTAANLMFDQVGGPSHVQAWLRAHGDRTTNVDRTATRRPRIRRPRTSST